MPDTTRADQLLNESDPLAALEEEQYRDVRQSLLAVLNLYEGFASRAERFGEEERVSFQQLLGERPIEALAEQGVPPEMAAGLFAAVGAPQEVVEEAAKAEPSPEIGPIIPAAFWGIQALLRTPAGARLTADLVARHAPTVLRGTSGMKDALAAVRQLAI
jgi:hypothetical protein